MFGIFFSERSRAVHDARNWLHLAEKVVDYRRDQLPPQEILAIQQAANELKNRVKGGADAAKLKNGMERLEGCLRRSGGSHYPKSSTVDNVEFLLVALILFLGIRTFFVQPFKIPTNSMWPSFYGMTAEVFQNNEQAPGKAESLFRLLAFGATSYRINAPTDGEIRIAHPIENGQIRPYRVVPSRKWILFPDTALEYTFLVGDTPVFVKVPVDFRLEKELLSKLFPDAYDGRGALLTTRGDTRWINTPSGSMEVRTVDLGRHVRAGDTLFSFDILTGDQLFVDRMSYHFVSPKPGDSFVFRTDNIPYIEGERGPKRSEKYYVKRLVGAPGDTLEVRDHVLFTNGKPTEGSPVFGKETSGVEQYPGYTNAGSLLAGQSVTVPDGYFFAMGDNSPDSADSRFWGFVPAGDVAGRPLFIYFPFTRRWGPAK